MRRDRVAQQMKREIALCLQKDIHDSRIGFVTITRVDLSSNLRNAKVYLTVLYTSLKQRNLTFRALKSSRGYISGKIARRINLKYSPELIFLEDKDQLDSYKINKILQNIDDEKSTPVQI